MINLMDSQARYTLNQLGDMDRALDLEFEANINDGSMLVDSRKFHNLIKDYLRMIESIKTLFKADE